MGSFELLVCFWHFPTHSHTVNAFFSVVSSNFDKYKHRIDFIGMRWLNGMIRWDHLIRALDAMTFVFWWWKKLSSKNGWKCILSIGNRFINYQFEIILFAVSIRKFANKKTKNSGICHYNSINLSRGKKNKKKKQWNIRNKWN